MPSWCVPRKGTDAYERVMKIRQGETPKTFKEIAEELERKTGGKPKKVLRKLEISLEPSKVVQHATLPTLAEPPKTEVPTKKSSDSNNKKAMAVVPVTYIAEGGSKKNRRRGGVAKEEPKEVAKEEPKEVAEGGSGKSVDTLYTSPPASGGLGTLWALNDDKLVKVGHWTEHGLGLGFTTGYKLNRVKTPGRDSFINGKKETPLTRLTDDDPAFQVAAKKVLAKLGYDVSSLPDSAEPFKPKAKEEVKEAKKEDPVKKLKAEVEKIQSELNKVFRKKDMPPDEYRAEVKRLQADRTQKETQIRTIEKQRKAAMDATPEGQKIKRLMKESAAISKKLNSTEEEREHRKTLEAEIKALRKKLKA